MAKINNSAVIQKLIDELELSPAKDLIPTELAEKILPVFQVNSEDVTINIKENVKLYRDITANDNDKTNIVPDGKTWQLKMFNADYTASATINNRVIRFEILDASSNRIFTTDCPAVIEPTQQDNLAFFAGALNTDTAVMDADKGFQCVSIPKLTLPEGYGIRIYDAADRDAVDDIIISILVDEQDE